MTSQVPSSGLVHTMVYVGPNNCRTRHGTPMVLCWKGYQIYKIQRCGLEIPQTCKKLSSLCVGAKNQKTKAQKKSERSRSHKEEEEEEEETNRWLMWIRTNIVYFGKGRVTMVSGEEAAFHERIKRVECHYVFWYVQDLASLRRDG